MASMGWEKTGRRWRVFWQVTLRDGTVDKGSRSFQDKTQAIKFKEHCEKNEKALKQAVCVKQALLTDVVEEWKDWCLGLSETTQKLYSGEVRKFIESLPKTVIYITDLEKIHINTFLNSRLKSGCINKTVNNTMVSIKSLCRYMQENYHISNPSVGIKKLKEDPAQVKFLTLEQYHTVLANSPQYAQPWIQFLACTGLRAMEFCKLRWEHCDLVQKTITLVGKGRKKRTVGLNQTALQILEQMKVGKKTHPSDPVFLNPRRDPVTRCYLSQVIREACRNSGLAGGGAHALRHFFATQLLLKGVPIIKVSALCGHSLVTTTQRHYSHILSSDLTGITGVLDTL
jgi:site-specific recombinase XerD